MTNMKIVFVLLLVTVLNSINSLPTLGIYNGLPQTGLTQELLNILKNSGLHSLLSNSLTTSPFSKSNPSSNTPPASSVTLLPFENYKPIPQLPPPNHNPTDSNNNYSPASSISTPASDSAPLPPTVSNQQSNLDLLLNFNRNNQNSLPSDVSQKSAPNSYSTELLQSLLHPPIADTLPAKTTSTIASPLDPTSAPLPDLPQSPRPSPELVSLKPLSLSSKVNEEILKLLSGSPPTPLEEPIRNSNPDSIHNPESALPIDSSIIPPSSVDLPSASTDSPPPLLPTPPPPSTSNTLTANQLLNTLVCSPKMVKELTTILESFSGQNSNSKPSLTDAH